MKGDFWMKTRKLAAKALSVAVIATTVSGYAMAGDHSISVDISTMPYCNVSYGVDDTTDSFGGNGSCGASDVQINFSGKLGNGWDYAFNLDPSEWGDVDTATASSPVEKSAAADMLSSVAINKDLGNGLTLSLGDTGDSGKSKQTAGHWELANHSDPGTKGGMKVSYAKGNLDASFTLGSGRAMGDDDASLGSDISVGAGMKFGKFDVGGSYHMINASDVVFQNGVNKEGGNLEKISAMVFGAGGSFGNFNVAADFMTKTQNACLVDHTGTCAAATSLETKTTSMGMHLWASSGVFRPGFSYSTETVKNEWNNLSAETKVNAMGAGVAWHPKEGGPSVRLAYQNKKSSGKAPNSGYTGTSDVGDSTTNPETKISIKISSSVTVL